MGLIEGFLSGATLPDELDLARQRARRAGLENQSIQSELDDLNRVRAGRAQAESAYPGLLEMAQPQPGSIARSGTLDTGQNPEAAGTPAPVTPPRPAASNVNDLISRGANPSDVGAVQQYRPDFMKTQGLETPRATQEREQLGTAIDALDMDPATKAVYKAMAQSGSAEGVRALLEKQYQIVPAGAGILKTTTGEVTPSPNVGAGQPETMTIGGVRWTKVPNAQGLPTWQRAPEADSAVEDWIASHPKQVAGLGEQQARDLARSEIDKRKVTTRVEVTQPSISRDAVDRAADYVNQTGQLPPGLGFGNPRLRAQILDRAAQLAKEAGGDLGLAATQANFKANQAELSKLQTQRGPVLAFAATAHKNLDLAEQLSARVDRTQIPMVNKWLLSGQQKWTGDPNVAQFAAATRTAVNEFAKVTNSATGGGVTSDAARHEIESILSTAQTPEQFQAVVKTLRQEMQNRVKGYDEQIAATQARIGRLGGTAPPVPGGGEQRWMLREIATGRIRPYQPAPGETQPPAGYERQQ